MLCSQYIILSPFIFAVVTEEVAKEGCALMYADDLVLICETKEARQRFVAWRNALESKGLKVNISTTKVMRCARDVAPKEAAQWYFVLQRREQGKIGI